ncbi:hypothetical protein [Methanoplanus limicola]|uniref:Uncharacterized protein n=1 Tax=Methanoplanus limicola DSM 2279 TaxID=937775 RepID=H1Z186_9EURY|nr:hypothetical protein [Methanoplanus limicola]EHQ35353.1 hypothetical protein Metlim_1243 [Methanoplanus limicola DSM 2279]
MKKILAGNSIQKQLQTFIEELKGAFEKIQEECNKQDQKISELSALVEKQGQEIEVQSRLLHTAFERITGLEDNVKELKEDSELFERYARTAIENTKYQVRKLDVQNILNESKQEEKSVIL